MLPRIVIDDFPVIYQRDALERVELDTVFSSFD